MWLASRNVSPNAIAGAPNEFAGPMAKQHRMLVITIACLCSVVVPRSCQILHLGDFDMGVMSVALTVTIAGCVITVLRRFTESHAL